ncbi:MAG: polysaccharide biosynthesis/export family protein [Gemmataceae bacterium]|nr:polysaccharide biosynthesis/export family protein [Gemmataceae bacterium]
MRTAYLVLAAAVVGLLGLSWQAQRETSRRLDALAAAVARPADAPAPLPQVVAGPVVGVVPEELPKMPMPPHRAVPAVVPAAGAIPRELEKVALPPYVVEAPDILTIEVKARDRVSGELKPLPEQPIGGQFLVRPDGTVNLGQWGPVTVTGLTVGQVAAAVKKAGAAHTADELAVAVDVLAYNSKAYYVVADGDGGEVVYRFPCTGGDTVLDAVAQAGGHVSVSGRTMWVARQAAGRPPQILPVDWKGIAHHGDAATNYQLLPGDRLYVKAGK